MKTTIKLITACLITLAVTSTSVAGTIYVATAQNLRGALYLGTGPTPGHASEQAMVKCSQDSWLSCSCKIKCVRCEYYPDRPYPAAQRLIQKVKPVSWQGSSQK